MVKNAIVEKKRDMHCWNSSFPKMNQFGLATTNVF